MLPAHAEWLAAGDQQRQVRASSQQLGHLAGSRQELLEVIHHQQHAAVTKLANKAVSNRLQLGSYVERSDERRQHQLWVAHRGQIDEEDAVGELPVHSRGDGQRQASLAHATRSDQRQQPRILVAHAPR